MRRRRLLTALAAPLLLRTPAQAQDRLQAQAVDPSTLLGPRMPYTAFDQMPQIEITLGVTTIRCAIIPPDTPPGRDRLLGWIRRSAGAIAIYYGRLPTRAVRLLIVASSGDGIHGTTWGYRGPATRIRLGQQVTGDELDDDWVLVHEMVHMSTPSLPEEDLWLAEGLATYIEPIARAQAGIKPVAQVWLEMVRGMPKGQPAAGDLGFERTHSWGRTYWGGALFCLRADVEIRRASGNQRGLQDGLRALVAAGASNADDWTIDRFAAEVDRATGVPVVTAMVARERSTAVTVDLDDLWRRLGVIDHGDAVAFDDAAPLAGARHAIDAGKSK